MTTTSDALINTSALVKRYKDAFLIASIIVTLGTTLRILGLFAGFVLGFVAAYVIGEVFHIKGGTPIVGGIIFGLLVWFFFYVFAVLFSCQGQVLRANLDEAVFVCPFFSDSEKITAASLPTIRNG